MTTFYSLIKISNNSLSGDSLTIGMILSDSNEFKLKFSRRKVNLVKTLLSESAFIVDEIMKQIDAKVKELNSYPKKENLDFFAFNSHSAIHNYFEYLSNYSNGVLLFSKPNIIAKEIVTAQEFEKFYEMFVSDGVEMIRPSRDVETEKQFYHRVKTNLIDKVKDDVHTNLRLNNEQVPTLLQAFEIDCLGLNCSLIGAKSLPFTQAKDTLHKNINTYTSVIAHLSYTQQKSLEDNKFYLIADEPKASDRAERRYWNDLRKNDGIFKIIPSGEAEEVANLIKQRGAHTFLN